MKSFKVQPFDQRVYVTSCPIEFVKRYNLYADEPMGPEEMVGVHGMAAHAVRKKAPHALFAIYVNPSAAPSVVWHESLHMAHFLMEYAGMPIDFDSTELQAYTMEHVAASVLKKLA